MDIYTYNTVYRPVIGIKHFYAIGLHEGDASNNSLLAQS